MPVHVRYLHRREIGGAVVIAANDDLEPACCEKNAPLSEDRIVISPVGASIYREAEFDLTCRASAVKPGPYILKIAANG